MTKPSIPGPVPTGLIKSEPPTRPQASAALQVLSSASAEYKGSRKEHQTIENAQRTIGRLIEAFFAPPASEASQDTEAKPDRDGPMPPGAVPSS